MFNVEIKHGTRWHVINHNVSEFEGLAIIASWHDMGIGKRRLRVKPAA